MVTKTKKHFSTFLVIFLSFTRGNHSQYSFEFKEIPDATLITIEKKPGDESIKDDFLSKLSDELKKQLCTEAKDFASFDGMGQKADIFLAYGYKFEYPDKSSAEFVAMRCATIPVCYLRYSLSQSNKVIIIRKENEFLTDKYSFPLQIVESEPMKSSSAVPRIGPSSKEQQSLLLKTNINLLNICIAAKNRIDYQPKPVIESTPLDKLGILEIVLPDRTVITPVTMKCPSSPPMFLYSESSPPNVTIINVVLVKAKSQEQSAGQ